MEEEVSEATLKRYKNLRAFKDYTDEQIIDHIRHGSKREKKIKAPATADSRVSARLRMLRNDYAVDMNPSDSHQLESLARLHIQAEDTDKRISDLYAQEDIDKNDVLLIEKLSDVQRNLNNSIKDIQDKLGIQRKQRKEKETDDLPKFIDQTLIKAKTYFDRVTTKVMCPKDEIELARYWLNFPKRKHETHFSLECPKCGEMIET